MSWFDALHFGGNLCIQSPGGHPEPVLIGGRPVTTLTPGWRPRGAYAGFSPFLILDLSGDDDRYSFWVLDAQHNFLGSDARPLEGIVRNEFVEVVRPVLARLANNLIESAQASLDSQVQAFFCLPRQTRESIIAYIQQLDLAPYPEITDLVAADTVEWSTTAPDGRTIILTHDRMMRVLHVFLNDRFIDGIRTKCLRWPFLTQDGLNDDIRYMIIDYRLGVLRAIEPGCRLVYYVIVWGAKLQSVAVYVPSARKIFTYSTGGPGVFMRVLGADPQDFINQLARLYLCSGAPLLNWLKTPPTAFSSFMWPGSVAHLGHYLWNETSGLEIIVKELEPNNFPTIFALGAASGLEFYGPTADLFPELAGHLVKSFDNIPSMREHCYASGMQAVRVSGQFVSADVRQRVMGAVLADPDVRLLQEFVAGSLLGDAPTIVLGLRLTDRTHAELGKFYCAVIDHLLQHVPRLTVVIDGVNSRPGQARGSSYNVFSGNRPARGLIDIEGDVVRDIQAHVAGRPIDVIDCVGTTMRINLFWISRAHMFVAPWGAGLVKYRWICNRPGFVLASRSNLLNPFALPIYHFPDHMENPTEMEFVDPNLVHDLHSAGEVLDAQMRDANLRAGGISGVNFTLDTEAVLPSIAALFRRSLEAARSSPS